MLSPEFGYVLDNFYNVIDREWHSRRAHGVFSNPNVSAFMINLLLVMTFLVKRYEMLKSNSTFIILFQFLVSFVALLILSSISHLILFSIIALFYIQLIIRKSRLRKAIAIGVVLFLVTLFQFTTPSMLQKNYNNFETLIIYNALKAQGVEIVQGYSNLHLLPIFQNKIAYGTKGFPWTLNKKSKVRYKKGICPIAEDLNDNTLLILGMYSFEYSFKDIEMIGNAFKKVWKNLKLHEI